MASFAPGLALFLLVAAVGTTTTTTTTVPPRPSPPPTSGSSDTSHSISLSNEQCANLMLQHSLSPGFHGNVAHGVHSITLEDLREYFEPDTPEENRIPNINLDLMSPHPVLFSAPKSGVDPRIKTQGMRSLDQVLSHMDDPTYDLKNYNTVERIAHVMHMQEMYAMVQPIYQAIAANPPSDREAICHCVNDIENNGVKDMLYFMALKIREPDVMTNVVMRRNGTHVYMDNGRDLHDKEGEELDQSEGEEQQQQLEDNHVKRRSADPDARPPGSDWSGNLYKFRFRRSAEPEPEADAKPPGSDWSGNLYKFRFRRSAEPEPEADAKPPGSDWSGNLYKYRFRRSAEPEPEADAAPPGSYWTGNLYKFRFGRSAGPEPEADGRLYRPVIQARRRRSLFTDPKPIVGNPEKEDGMPRLVNEEAWKYWKDLALGMDEQAHYDLAMFLYCALQN